MDVEWVSPPTPSRGGRPEPREQEERLSKALRAEPGRYAVYGRYGGPGTAESVRRRIHRASGPWAGGRAAWSVMVRKVEGDRWLVCVAYRADEMGVAS